MLHSGEEENLTKAQLASRERARLREELKNAKGAKKNGAVARRVAVGGAGRGSGKAGNGSGEVSTARKGSGEGSSKPARVVNKTEAGSAKPAKAAKPAKSNVHPQIELPKAPKIVGPKAAITPVIFGQLQTAFNFFNDELWGGRLPQVVLLFARKPRSYGYFWAERWGQKKDGEVHEIALNPDHMRKEDAKKALSTEVHEMAHLWQFVLGEKCPTRPYHNKEFSAEMERVGLITSSTGEVGGKRTGQKMTHYIAKGGAFDKAADKLIATGFKFEWSSFPAIPKESKSGQRTKYVCPECDQKAWAKEGIRIACEECEETMVPA